MEVNVLVRKLNWFYSLETTQVDNYLAQSKVAEDPYIISGLERIAILEQEHVDNISSIIIELGAKPTVWGDVISTLLGTALGKILGTTNLITMFKMNIKIEAKACQDYNQLINELMRDNNEQTIIKTLQYNLIDEDLHSSWFNHVIKYKEKRPWPLSVELAKKIKNS